MPWFRLDDSFHSHPKVIAAGNEATGLYVRCGTYAAQHLTDGFIPEQVALQYGTPALAAKLVETRLWRRARGGWRMPDYLDYNPSRQETVDKRKVRAEAGRLGGLASGKTRSKREANASPVLEPPARPDPRNGSALTDGARASPAPVHNPKPISSMTNGAATRQPPPVAEAIDRALHPEDHPPARGRHAKENP